MTALPAPVAGNGHALVSPIAVRPSTDAPSLRVDGLTKLFGPGCPSCLGLVKE